MPPLLRLPVALLLGCLAWFPAWGQQKARVEIIHSDRFEFSKFNGAELRRLIGQVVLRHNGTLMYCDSAYQFIESNTVQAFGNIRMIQGDTLWLYGDQLDYDGNTRTGQIRKKVRLVDKGMTLTTDVIDFDFAQNISQYDSGGKIVDSVNTLTSKMGYYFSEKQEFLFRGQVNLKNKDYTMTSDTLRYNTRSHIAYFLGFTTILSDSNRIVCRSGWYDTEKDVTEISRDASVERGPNVLKGDKIYYERKKGFGRAYGNVVLVDTTEKIRIRGDLATYNEQTEKGLVTGKAFLTLEKDADTLFLHADTLKIDPAPLPKKKQINAFHHVRFFRTDFQGKCDSLHYSQADSTFRFRGNPVLWTDQYQVSAQTIDLLTDNRKPSKLVLRGASFVISQLDSLLFNQISGKDLDGFFKKNRLQRIDVKGNGETIYYPEDNKEKIGHNKVICSDITVFMDEGTVKRIHFLTQPDAVLTPLSKVRPEDKKLNGFRWLDLIRPKSPQDVFIWK